MLKKPMEQVFMNKTNNHQKTRKLQPFNVKGFKNSKKTNHQTLHNRIPKHPKNIILVCFFIISRVQR